MHRQCPAPCTHAHFVARRVKVVSQGFGASVPYGAYSGVSSVHQHESEAASARMLPARSRASHAARAVARDFPNMFLFLTVHMHLCMRTVAPLW